MSIGKKCCGSTISAFILLSFIFVFGLLSALPANGQDITLYITKSRPGTDWQADLNWTQGPFTGQNYEVRRGTDAATLVSGSAWKTLAALATTDTDLGYAGLIFYNIKPVSPTLTLSWEGINPGLTDDGFLPTPVEDYADAVEDLTISGDACEFRVTLTSSSGLFPTTIEVLVDRNADGDYDDAGEVVPLGEADSGDTDTADGKLYYVALPGSIDSPEAPGTIPSAGSPLYVRNELGNTRWDFLNTTGEISYKFRATDASGIAGGEPTFDRTLIALNTAQELIDDLGKPVVAAATCPNPTDWHTALVYFEEAEARVAPASPYNLASEPNRNMYYLNAILASTLAETGYTLQNYHTLFETPDTKRYRDTMLDWKLFADEQVLRMEHLSTWALSEPNTPWEFQFPGFCIYLEDTGSGTPFVNIAGMTSGSSYFGLPMADPAMPASSILGFADALTPKKDPAGGSKFAGAADPIYTFPQAYWDRADAHMLAALFRGWRAAAIAARIYENSGAARPVTVADLDAIDTWLEPEDDAEAHYKCDPEPCAPLNGIDDDGDGLVDDLGYAARVFETFDGVGIYSPDAANGCTLETAANDASAASNHLREAFKTVLKETDIQADDATIMYGDGGNHPPLFIDIKSYNGLLADGVTPCPDPGNCADGMPDLQWVSGQFLPVPWCPPAQAGDPEPPLYNTPISIRGGLSDDITWWMEKLIDAYNKMMGDNLSEDCYPEAWMDTLFATDWGYTWEQAVADTTPHYVMNFRDDIEEMLADRDIDPADLGADFQTFLEFAESIDVRLFVENPENIRNYVPYYCPAHTEPVCGEAENYTFNGFWGDWDEPCDPIVPDKFWTIEPFAVFNQDANGILDAACDPANLNTDSGCLQVSWNDKDGDGEFDMFEPLLMANYNTPTHYIDLNGDGQWNGWTDRDHKKALYAGEPADPGQGLYNALYVYFQDPTFGGRLPGMTNEGLNNFVSAAAGLSDGMLEFPSDNHAPSNYHMVEEFPTAPGANLRLVITATDADGDTLHYHLVLPSSWSGAEVIVDGRNTGVYELAVPAGTWGFVGLVYDNVNNLNDIVGAYMTITR